MITLPAYIEKIASDKDGGFTIRIVASQIATEQVKGLLDCIGNTVFSCSFDRISDLEVEKRSPGRPKKDTE